MKIPKPIEIVLTPEQILQLQQHYTYVAQDHEAGRTGILLGQVGHTRAGRRHEKMVVGFVPNIPAARIIRVLADYRREQSAKSEPNDSAA